MTGNPPSPRRSLAVLAGFAVAGIAVLCALGLWQLQRGAQKQAFIASLTDAVTVAPARDFVAAAPFSRVRLTGMFEAGSTVFVRVTLPESLGVYVMTPLVTASGQRIFINRGFLKTAQDGRPPAVATPQGEITVTGLKRSAEPRGWFATVDSPAARVFAVRDPQAFAAALALQGVAPDYLEAEPVAGAALPNGVDTGEVIARIPDNHLSYALTWFGLAGTLAGVFAMLVLRTRRERGGPAPNLATTRAPD